MYYVLQAIKCNKISKRTPKKNYIPHNHVHFINTSRGKKPRASPKPIYRRTGTTPIWDPNKPFQIITYIYNHT